MDILKFNEDLNGYQIIASATKERIYSHDKSFSYKYIYRKTDYKTYR